MISLESKPAERGMIIFLPCASLIIFKNRIIISLLQFSLKLIIGSGDLEAAVLAHRLEIPLRTIAVHSPHADVSEESAVYRQIISADNSTSAMGLIIRLSNCY